ncbi:MAG: guanylate kinase [Thermincola sp.]|jgi:guanylate kinase|nr:guanylate kinase [Thermincola sp.]MDT3704006.1 guanylate kinase [Thermincola sp.]
MTVPGLLIIISGPSGTGKGTICKALLQHRPDIYYSISATTRSPRDGEQDGISYHFKSKEEFEEMLDHDEFLEWARVYDNYYGTPKAPVAEAIAAGRDVILEIDVQGALKVKEKAPEGIYIFVAPPSVEVLRSRIVGRATDSMEIINKRMDKVLGEMSKLNEYNYIVINDVLAQAVNKVESIIEAEKCRTQRHRFMPDGGPQAALVVPKL